ncbi:MAG: succinylglutamate desuccinylase [Candidatus Aminicenantes bacterium]|nr:succinylglutamate desuccinylase [Candidatus Aminicenantes bacterium]
MKKKIKKHHLIALCLLCLTGALCWLTGVQFLSMRKTDTFYPSPGLSAQTKLSDYFSQLADSPGDTAVYCFKGEEEGGNLLILGGTHPNEPAGFITAVLLLENITVSRGKIFIIPQANLSGFTHDDPFEGNPQKFSLETPGGRRWFRFGSRLTNPTHQWPDPTLFTNAAGQALSGTEVRNLNRSYPGKEKGHLTEQIAFGIMELIKKEEIDLSLDLHEAAPEYPVVNAIVFHENSAELAAIASMELQMEDIDIRMEASPPSLRGLSHREWGDHTSSMAILLETANVSHGRLKGKPSEALIVEGKDPNYVKASKLGMLFVPYSEDGIPLKERVARHLAAVNALVSGLRELNPDHAIHIGNFPPAQTVNKRGIGLYLHPPK